MNTIINVILFHPSIRLKSEIIMKDSFIMTEQNVIKNTMGQKVIHKMPVVYDALKITLVIILYKNNNN